MGGERVSAMVFGVNRKRLRIQLESNLVRKLRDGKDRSYDIFEITVYVWLLLNYRIVSHPSLSSFSSQISKVASRF